MTLCSPSPAGASSRHGAGPIVFPIGPVVAVETVTGIRIMEAVRPFYEAARLAAGLQPGQEYVADRTLFSRWSPAEEAIIDWADAVMGRLVSHETGRPFRSQAALVAAMAIHYNFKRTAAQWQKMRRRRQ